MWPRNIASSCSLTSENASGRQRVPASRPSRLTSSLPFLPLSRYRVEVNYTVLHRIEVDHTALRLIALCYTSLRLITLCYMLH